jgi:hypothetical protein
MASRALSREEVKSRGGRVFEMVRWQGDVVMCHVVL